ncbi:MAG: OmpA family protein [Paracoccaceae bacterium]|jgi:OOP family OmpA-OmpF porin|nr:OmpA family protein [Paracoccaceae bacterium]
MRQRAAIATLALALATSVQAAPPELTLPQGAGLSAHATNPATSYDLLTGPWHAGGGEHRALEGARADTAWRLRANQMTTLQILADLREQIVAAGYLPLYACETDDCGGFDFRYALDLLPEPEMHVDLGDFRYLAASRGAEFLALTVSRSSESGFVHLTTLTAQAIATAQPSNPLQSSTPTPAPGPTTGLAARLDSSGAAVLEDLIFESGKVELEPAEFDSLRALADYLSTRPETRIALVGHTDTDGGLAGNIAISQKRAAAVRARLIADYGVTPAQVTAEGAGWLAPRASNQTPEGRAKNRRVEVIITSTQG